MFYGLHAWIIGLLNSIVESIHSHAMDSYQQAKYLKNTVDRPGFIKKRIRAFLFYIYIFFPRSLL